MTETLETGTAVWGVLAGFTVAGRVLAGGDLILVDQCTIGQHLPQWYRPGELRVLTAEEAPRLGLCAACLGYGTTAQLCTADSYFPYSADELEDPCPDCGGSGRSHVKVTITRDGPGCTSANITIAPHEPLYTELPGGPEGICQGCGLAPDTHPHQQAPDPGGK
jgi:hypothetical protein